jgi:hypothetical protein
MVRSRLIVLAVLSWAARASASDAESTLDRVCLQWNETARTLVSMSEVDPLAASRAYALLSLAQLTAATGGLASPRYKALGRAGDKLVAVAISQASIDVLGATFEGLFNPRWRLQGLLEVARASGLAPGDVHIALGLGKRAAHDILAQRAHDLKDVVEDTSAPPGPVSWHTLEGQPGLRPSWGGLRPILIASADRYLPPPPPPAGSAELAVALREVKSIHDGLTPDQEQSAQFWADGAGTATPPGHWNEIASDLLAKTPRSELETARVLASVNVAMFDAGVVCWRAKYKFWLARPSQLDDTIKPLLHVPNFPSYISGHSSFSAAAAETLSHFFPGDAAELWKMAREASFSRVLGGIHYRFDCDAGLDVGQRVGAEVVTALTADPRALLKLSGSRRR